ncbi:DUF308 domain-containing protein [Devosia sp. ZB163]|uniref:HdeD family acid-resistance protein n=1 Tax=Devosia sp. ZB163 TaxID=3025938 RepID=UPI00235F47EE|nr:DUF308 domain-containing protein [Devosia sp. ZB163]MDC9825761.1 DUF308 domain-containing protein [Devosia sp. ZB163]
MAISSDTRRRWAWITGLRGLLMLLAGIYAIIFPSQALVVLVLFGGALLLVDGVLGLWSLTFGGAKTGNYWFDVVRNALAIITGVLILISPFVATLLTATFLVYLVAFQSIFVGVMEIWVIVREREHYAKIWPVLLSGVAYVVFGVALLFFPMTAAWVFVILGGILAIIFAIGLFGLAWRMYQSAKGAPKA